MQILDRINYRNDNNWTEGQWKKTVIFIHATVTEEKVGGARLVAGWFARPGFNASTQYVVDDREVVQCVPEKAYAWAAGTTANERGIHIEFVAMPQQTRGQWADTYSTDELRLGARLVAELAVKYGIPLQKLTAEQLRADKSGIAGHSDARDAWHETTHWDPGDGFPWDRFLKMCRAEHRKLIEPTPAPTPVVDPPAPAPRVSPNADTIAASAERGAHATKGKRRAVYLKIRDLIKPLTTKK